MSVHTNRYLCWMWMECRRASSTPSSEPNCEIGWMVRPTTDSHYRQALIHAMQTSMACTHTYKTVKSHARRHHHNITNTASHTLPNLLLFNSTNRDYLNADASGNGAPLIPIYQPFRVSCVWDGVRRHFSHCHFSLTPISMLSVWPNFD